MDHTDAIREYYNADVENEWTRIDGRPEFILSCRFLNRYIQPGDRVLDIGGGPGRYSPVPGRKGLRCHPVWTSPLVNVRFALDKAAALGLPLHVVEGDARTADQTVQGQL